MPTKIAEKKIALGIICLVAGIFLFINTPLTTTPVYVSEKGIVLCIVAFVLVALGVWFFKRAASKV